MDFLAADFRDNAGASGRPISRGSTSATARVNTLPEALARSERRRARHDASATDWAAATSRPPIRFADEPARPNLHEPASANTPRLFLKNAKASE